MSQLHRALEVRVGQLMGKNPSIWRDQKLQGIDYFDQTIIERLQRAGVLVSVLTPRYIRSDWCYRELKEFYKMSALSGRARDENKARIFKVLKTPVPIADHPVELQPLLGYEFFKVDPQTGKAREWDQAFGPEVQRTLDFWTKLDDLAQDLCALLRELESGEEATSATRTVSDKGTVYLAETSFDMKDRRDEVRRDLQAHGYRVLPDISLPLNAPELEMYLEQALAQCRLSVHLIGKNYGVVPEGSEQSISVLQFESAIQRKHNGGFSSLVWIPLELDVEDARQSKFIDSLRSDTRIQDGADLLETPFEGLNTQIHELLEPPKPPPPKPPRPISIKPDDAHISIYLICDQRDVKNVSPVMDALLERYEVFLSAFEGDEEAVRKDHEANLRDCDGVLIYYGAADELWLRCKQRELLKCSGLGRVRPLRATAIVVAPPKTPQKDRLRTHEALVIHLSDPFAPACLAPFIDELSQEAESRNR